MNKIVFLVAGGTGGHLFPAIALASLLKKIDPVFLVDKRTEKIISKYNYKYYIVSSEKLEKNILKLPLILFKILKGFFFSIYLIFKQKPSVIVGFGGYTSIPSLFAAKILNKKILIHEQNSVMGRSNRLLSKIADKVAVTYKTTKYASNSCIFTGIPIRVKKEKKLEKKKEKKNLLIIGGSQGAKFFEEIMKNLIKNLDKQSKKELFVIQQVREEDILNVKNFYKNHGIEFKIKNFFNNIYEEIANADIIISRCGSSSLAEIEYFKKFSILIPLPYSTDNHQYYNAKEFKKKNNCVIINQNNINYSNLARIIKGKFISDNKGFDKIKKKTKKKTLENIINDMLK